MKRSYLFALALTLLYVSVANAQYPVMDMVANKVIQKYQTATCEQLWEKKAQEGAALAAGAEGHPDAEKRSSNARGIHRQDRRSDRQQDVRMRHDSVSCDGSSSWRNNMMTDKFPRWPLLLVLGLFLLAGTAYPQTAQQPKKKAAPPAKPAPANAPSRPRTEGN